MEAGVTEESTMLRLPDLSRLTLHATPIGTVSLTDTHELTAEDVKEIAEKDRERYLAFYRGYMQSDRRLHAWQLFDYQKRMRVPLDYIRNWLKPHHWETDREDAVYEQEQQSLEPARKAYAQSERLRRWIGLQAVVKRIDQIAAMAAQNTDASFRSSLLSQVADHMEKLEFYQEFVDDDVTATLGPQYEALRTDAKAAHARAQNRLQEVYNTASYWLSDFNAAYREAENSVDVERRDGSATQRAGGGGRGSATQGRRKFWDQLRAFALTPEMDVVYHQIKTLVHSLKEKARAEGRPGDMFSEVLNLKEAGLGTFKINVRVREKGDAVDMYVHWTNMRDQKVSIATSDIDVDWKWSTALRSQAEIQVFLDWLWRKVLTQQERVAAKTWSQNKPG
jgi:hypothetical protein